MRVAVEYRTVTRLTVRRYALALRVVNRTLVHCILCLWVFELGTNDWIARADAYAYGLLSPNIKDKVLSQ